MAVYTVFRSLQLGLGRWSSSHALRRRLAVVGGCRASWRDWPMASPPSVCLRSSLPRLLSLQQRRTGRWNLVEGNPQQLGPQPMVPGSSSGRGAGGGFLPQASRLLGSHAWQQALPGFLWIPPPMEMTACLVVVSSVTCSDPGQCHFANSILRILGALPQAPPQAPGPCRQNDRPP